MKAAIDLRNNEIAIITCERNSYKHSHESRHRLRIYTKAKNKAAAVQIIFILQKNMVIISNN